jgi:hypothetical protein
MHIQRSQHIKYGDQCSERAQHNDIKACLAQAEEMKHEAYKLRYQSYASAGFVLNQKSRTVQDLYDGLPSTRTILLYKNNQPVASARVCLIDSDDNQNEKRKIPSYEIFSEEIASILSRVEKSGRPAKGVEISKLARHPDSIADRDLIFGIFRMVGYLIVDLDADVVFMSVRMKHKAFYRRLGFEEVAGPREYPGLKGVEGFLMVCFRESFVEVQGQATFLRDIRQSDQKYSDFISGRTISVF